MSSPVCALVDWGTTSFRAWSIDADGRVLGERRGADGLTTASERGFSRVLETHLLALGLPANAPAILCGMVGARTGWVEANYLDTPLQLDDLSARAVRVPETGERSVFILPGLAQRTAGSPDVMRGEETQLLGVMAEGYQNGLVCMPGTHSKWVHLQAGSVLGFSTFMTGELFQLLRAGSILRQAVETDAHVDAASPAFADGVRAAYASPALATQHLFSLRAGWLLENRPPADGLARLSGLLIGLELAGAAARYGSAPETILLASGPIASLYTAAFEAIGKPAPVCLDADACVRHGLASAAKALIRSGV